MRNAVVLIISFFMVVISSGCDENATDMTESVRETVGEPEETTEENGILNTIVPVAESISVKLLAGEDQKEHLAQISLSLAVESGDESEAIIADINSRLDVIEGIIKSVLENKTFEEVKKDGGLESLKNEILTELKNEFKTNLISEVLADEFFLQ